MANLRDRVIFFPRFTTLAGSRDFKTLPINVTTYESGVLAAWMGDVVGPATPGNVTAYCEESTDQVNWVTCGGTGSALLAAGQETQIAPAFTKPWARFGISVAAGFGGDPIVSTYAIGFLVRRKGASPPP